MGTNGPTAKTYPTKDQYQQWKDEADEMDMSVSQFISSMVEAGRKKFDAVVEPDATNLELREERNDAYDELRHERQRVEKLEQRLLQGERRTVIEFVRNNPGAEWEDVTNHIIQSAPERVRVHLADLEGDRLRREGGRWYLKEGRDE